VRLTVSHERSVTSPGLPPSISSEPGAPQVFSGERTLQRLSCRVSGLGPWHPRTTGSKSSRSTQPLGQQRMVTDPRISAAQAATILGKTVEHLYRLTTLDQPPRHGPPNRFWQLRLSNVERVRDLGGGDPAEGSRQLLRCGSDDVRKLIADGKLPVGSEHSYSRDLAALHNVSVGTVSRAIAEPEHRGLIEAAQDSGATLTCGVLRVGGLGSGDEATAWHLRVAPAHSAIQRPSSGCGCGGADCGD
jgi:hypothetical protein